MGVGADGCAGAADCGGVAAAGVLDWKIGGGVCAGGLVCAGGCCGVAGGAAGVSTGTVGISALNMGGTTSLSAGGGWTGCAGGCVGACTGGVCAGGAACDVGDVAAAGVTGAAGAVGVVAGGGAAAGVAATGGVAPPPLAASAGGRTSIGSFMAWTSTMAMMERSMGESLSALIFSKPEVFHRLIHAQAGRYVMKSSPRASPSYLPLRLRILLFSIHRSAAA